MFLRNERGLGVKNGTLGTIEQVCTQSMTVRTYDGRNVAFDLKDYDRIDHGYAATIHKAQGMTVDRTHVLATPGLDRHGSYVAFSRHRDDMDMHYGRDDFAGQDRLVNTLSRDRAKDMASDYEQGDPAQEYAERRGIAFRERMKKVVGIVRQVPGKVRGMFDGLRLSAGGSSGVGAGERLGREKADAEGAQGETAAPERDVAEEREAALRKARTRALIRHARALESILATGDADGRGSPEQMRELRDARKAFEKVHPYGWRDAEAAYVKNPQLALEAASGRPTRAIRALQLEAELRTDPQLRANRFVQRWQKLDRTSERQYAAGDYSGYHAARKEMGNMAMSLERDAQMESLLRGRKRELGISMDFNSGRSLGRDLAISHGLGIGRGRSIGL
jgi:hypothetical protein